MTAPMMSQQMYKAHEAFSKAHPEWAHLALKAVNRWGRGEVTLAQSVAEALMQAYEDGKNGVEIVAPAPQPTTKKIIRRTR